MFQAVSKHGWNLEHASPDLRKDPIIVLAAVQNNGWAFQWADDSLKYDKYALLPRDKCALLSHTTTHTCKHAFPHTRPPARARVWVRAGSRKGVQTRTPERMLALSPAVARTAFGFACRTVRRDRRDFVLKAMGKDCSCLHHAPELLKQDKPFILRAVSGARPLAYRGEGEQITVPIRPE